jgi:hypothetical protein
VSAAGKTVAISIASGRLHIACGKSAASGSSIGSPDAASLVGGSDQDPETDKLRGGI